MIGTVLETDDLARISGYASPAAICTWLRGQGITFKTGRDGRPFTTTEALNHALGVPGAAASSSKLNPDLF